MLLTRLVPMFVKNVLNSLAISSVFVVSLIFIMKDSGKHSDLYLAKVDAK